MSRIAPPVTSSLAAVRPGDEVQIQQILLPSLQVHCDGLGMSVGDLLRCRSSGQRVLLENAAGRTISLDIDLARFIQVASTPAVPHATAG